MNLHPLLLLVLLVHLQLFRPNQLLNKRFTHKTEEIFYILTVKKFFVPLPGTELVLGGNARNLP